MSQRVLEVISSIEVLDEQRKREGGPQLWRVGRDTAELLRFLVSATSAKTILELGCSSGYSALWLALGAKQTGGHVYTTEIFPSKVELATKHFKESGLDNITLIAKDIGLVLDEWDKPLDLVFIDAEKKKYFSYYQKAMSWLKKGGVIVADNVDSHREEMQDFLTAVRNDPLVTSSHVPIDNGLLLVVKN